MIYKIGGYMFQNNINGKNNKIKIEQNVDSKSNVFKDIVIGLIVTVVGGLVLYIIVG